MHPTIALKAATTYALAFGFCISVALFSLGAAYSSAGG